MDTISNWLDWFAPRVTIVFNFFRLFVPGKFIGSVVGIYEGKVNIENKYNQDNGLAVKHIGMFDFTVALLSLPSSIYSAFDEAQSPGRDSKEYSLEFDEAQSPGRYSKVYSLAYILNAWVSGKNLLHAYNHRNVAAVALQQGNALGNQ